VIPNDAWMAQIATMTSFSVQYLQEFTKLWDFTSQLNLLDNVPDTIIWKLTDVGVYSFSLAYKAQFTRAIRSEMDAFVWKNWPSM
jgi:hypothetical protein